MENNFKNIDYYIVPSIQQRLYLGPNLWKKFQVAPNVTSHLQLPVTTPRREVHVIDTGDVKPIKQRHYLVSPAIKKFLYA